VDKTGKLSSREMQAVVAKQYKFGTSTTMCIIDTLAMAAFAVVGVNGAVQRGLYPLVDATSGVTICFGEYPVIRVARLCSPKATVTSILIPTTI
jgi:pseudouridine-5'-phosphate glycosidase